MAKSRAIHLSSAADFVLRSLDRADPPLPLAQRQALFRRRLLAERDSLEALHLDVLAATPADIDPEIHVGSVFDGIERFSRSLVSGRMPNAVSSARLAAEGLAVTDQTLALWDAEVSQVIAHFELADGEAMRRAVLKLIHEARVAGIAEFRARLSSPAAAYQDDTAMPEVGGEHADTPIPPAVANGALPPYQPAQPERGLPARGRIAAAKRHVRPPLDRPSPEWAQVSVVEAGQRYIASQPKAGAGASPKLKKARRTWDPKTLRQFESAVMLLGKACPGPIWQLQQGDLDRFATLLDRLPARSHHKSARHDTMSLEEIAAEAQAQVVQGRLSEDDIGLMPQTTNRHFRFLRSLCAWVQKRVPQMAELDWTDFLIEEDDDAREQRDAFTIEQARMLFSLPTWMGFDTLFHRDRPGSRIVHDAGYWVPLLALYTGARRDEVAKLMVSDIGEEAGIAYLRVEETESGGIKTARSRRIIPVADELIRLGFLNYADAIRRDGQAVLFPDLVPGTASQKMGDVYYKRYWSKIARRLPFLKRGQAMHAFQHMVSTELKAAEVFEEKRSDLLGHACDNPMADRYSKATRLAKLRTVVNKIPVVTDHLQPVGVKLCKARWSPRTANGLPCQCETSRSDSRSGKFDRRSTRAGGAAAATQSRNRRSSRAQLPMGRVGAQ
ncbi:site-specific integrase [Novosphingobium sp. BL-8A]|uniref:site-specific integrase n=1 Tax=Novosphingobium sp. BL-8A TaxID=3127639 RepID=UPI003758005D